MDIHPAVVDKIVSVLICPQRKNLVCCTHRVEMLSSNVWAHCSRRHILFQHFTLKKCLRKLWSVYGHRAIWFEMRFSSTISAQRHKPHEHNFVCFVFMQERGKERKVEFIGKTFHFLQLALGDNRCSLLAIGVNCLQLSSFVTRENSVNLQLKMKLRAMKS